MLKRLSHHMATGVRAALISTGAAALLCAAIEAETPPDATPEPVTEPTLFAEGIISTPFDEFGSTFTRDGRTVFFTRSVPRSNVYVICQSDFRNGRWTEPE